MKDLIIDGPERKAKRRFTYAIIVLVAQLFVAAALAALEFNALGVGLFVSTPLTVGVVAGLISTWRQMWMMMWVLLAVPSVVLVFVGIEGLLCVAMAAPLLAIMLALGYWFGYLIRRFRENRAPKHFHAIAWLPLAVFLISSGTERLLGIEPTQNQSSTSIIVAAPPAQAFAAIVHVDTVRAAPTWLHQLGLPLPLASHLDTLALGARRTCYLTDGIIAERITELDAPHSVSLDMGGASMGRAWLQLEQDDYLFEPTISGGTRITHTTHFKSQLRPRIYWAIVERYTVAAQHRIVFNNLQLDLAQERLNTL